MPPSWFAVFRILYRLLTMLARLAVRSGRSKDLELIVLRHRNAALRRQIGRPVLTDDDPTLLGAVAAALPRRLRDGWIVTPETLLRWHRRRIAEHWTKPPARRIGRPATSAELPQLIVRLGAARGLVRYRGSQFVDAFDEIFRTEGFKILRTPVRTPVANSFAERWIGSIRRELLDRTIIWNRRHIERLVPDYIAHYNQHRPHQSLHQRPPTPADTPLEAPSATLTVLRTSRCDGLIHEYRNAA